MKPRFRWQTEEEASWPEKEEKAAPTISRRRRWLLAAAALVLTAVSLFAWQQARQIAAREASIQEDIIASHRTWRESVTSADLELFTYLISATDPDWQNAQKRLFAHKLVLDRAPLGLVAQPGAAEVTAVSLQPDWQAATVTYEQRYDVLIDAVAQTSVRLQQTNQYRRDGDRWLQTPPTADFWGATETFTGRWLTLTYPQRDAAWAERLGRDLDADLDAICDVVPEVACPDQTQIRLATDPTSLTALRDLRTPTFDGRSYLLPTPTLVGLPVDDAGYDALYRGYTDRILTSFQTRLTLPVPLPTQDLVTLCFPDRRQSLRLFRYDALADTWTAVFSRRVFRFLSPLPDDSGLILQEFARSSEASRLKLHRWHGGDTTAIFDEANSQWRFPPLGWSSDHLLLHGFDATSQVRTLYQWLDLDRCDADGCAAQDLPGFTAWSPDGRSSLVVIDSELWLGNAAGRPLRVVDDGFSPFWLDDATFGYIRYTDDEEERLMELAAMTVNDGSTQVLLRADQLTAALGQDAGLAFIRHAIPSPVDSHTIILMGPEIRGINGRYNVFALQLNRLWQEREDVAKGRLKLLLQLDETPRGYPTQLPPTGVPPVTFSPDGRWLLAAELTYPDEETWTFHLHDLVTDETRTIVSTYPAYPAHYPFYDWSADGRWLAIMDDGFLRLTAPAQDYERLIPFEYNTCLFTAWINESN